MSQNSQNAAALRELGAVLRQARDRSGMTQRDLASAAGFRAHSRISEFETAKALGSTEEYERLLDALGITDLDARERILSLASQAAEGPSVLQVGSEVIDQTLVELVGHEEAADVITVAGPLLLPGLVQTTAYARRIYGDSAGAASRLALRVLRREILTRRNPVRLNALIDTEALLRPVLPQDEQVDQLRHLMELAKLDNVTLQLVSSTTPGYHPMLSGQFELIQYATAPSIVLLDHYHASVWLRHPADVAKYVEAAEHLREKVAMTPDESIGVIAEIVNGQETT